MLSSRLRGLYAVTPDQPDSAQLLVTVAAAVAGGCRLVQYRNKLADTALRQQQAALLANFCKLSGVVFLVNDDLDLALAVDADGVHLGGEDGDPIKARQRLGPRKILGISCYNDPARVAAAVAAGASYVALGAMFPSTTKPAARRASLELLRQIKQSCPLPVATIGGISLANAPSLVAAGADMIAVVSELFGADDIEHRAQQFQHLFN